MPVTIHHELLKTGRVRFEYTADEQASAQVLMDSLATAIAKASADTAQWQAFKADLDANLGVVIGGGYYGHGLIRIADYALGYQCLKTLNPTLAADYADKAIGLLKVAVRELQPATISPQYCTYQYLGRGDGATTAFTLPGAPLSGTLVVRLAPVSHAATLRSSTSNHDTFGVHRHIIKVANTSDGAAAYAQTTDWRHGAATPDQYIDWTGAASKPANGATYYISYADVTTSSAVNSADYAVNGSTLTFTTAPATNQAVFVSMMYHDTTTPLRYQQTINDHGGAFSTLWGESGYATRNLAYVALGYDWLQPYAGLTPTLQTEIASMLVAWFTALDAGSATYGGTNFNISSPNVADSNYGTGHYLFRVFSGIALENRHASAPTIKTSALNWRTNNVLTKLGVPTSATTLIDGHDTEGVVYGSYGLRDLSLASIAIDEANWAAVTEEQALAGDVIRSFLHQQPTRSTIYTGGHGPSSNPYPAIYPLDSHWAVYAALATNAAAKGHANWHIQTGANANQTNYEDLLFRDPNAAANDPTDGDEPLYRFHRGTGLLCSRAAWNYTSTWLAAIGTRNSSAGMPGHYVATAGGILLYRGGDVLLADAIAQSGGYQGASIEHIFGSVVVTDDNFAGTMLYRYAPGVWHGTPGIVTSSSSTSAYSYFKCDYAAAYSNPQQDGNEGHLVELERELFHVRPDYVIVYDRIETDLAAQPKQLRWYLNSTSVTATGGTFTLAHNGTPTTALSHNATTAQVQAALEAIPAIGVGNVTVTAKGEVGEAPSIGPIGHYEIKFAGALSGTTQPLLTGSGSLLATLTGGIGRVRVQDMHQGAGSRLRQIVFLGETIADNQFSVTSGTSKLFGGIYSTSALSIGYETTQISGAGVGSRLRRVTAQNSSDAASVRYVTVLETVPVITATVMTSNEHVIGVNQEVEGARIGLEIALFRRKTAGITLPDTYSFTGQTGTTTHRIAGFSPSQVVPYSGAASGNATASSAGVIEFTTTATGAQSITLGGTNNPGAPHTLEAWTVGTGTNYLQWRDNSDNETGFLIQRAESVGAPLAGQWADLATVAANVTSYFDSTGLAANTSYYYRVRAFNTFGASAWSNEANATTQASGSTTFGFTLVDPGLDDLLDAWYTAEQTRQGTSSPLWWLWQVVVHPWASTDYPGLVIGHHYTTTGCKYFRNTCSTPGGSIGFVDATSSELGANSWQLGGAPGEINVMDVDGDGVAEHGCKQLGSGNGVWRSTTGTLTALTGVSLDGINNYMEGIGDYDADGDVDWLEGRWPLPVSLNSWSDIYVRTKSWNGSTYTSSDTPFTFPAGVPQSVIDDCWDRLKNTTAEVGQLQLYHVDIDGDGTNDLVIAGYFAYSSTRNFLYVLKNNGGGSYTDKTTDWGLARDGTFASLQHAQSGKVRQFEFFDSHLHKSIDGTTRLHFFILNHQTNCGMYRWNSGTSMFDKITGTLTSNLGSIYNFNEPYTSELYACDLTNQGRIDLILANPRGGRTLIFTNDGSGVFTRQAGPGTGNNYFHTWDPYGWACSDFNNNGTLDFVFGGLDAGGVGSGSLTRKFAWCRNDTTNPRNWLKVLLRRGTTANPFGIGGNVEIYEAGTATLLRRWPATLSGVPLHFGLGTRTTVDVKVNWPTGAATTLSGVVANQTITITS